jgi:TonB family protein
LTLTPKTKPLIPEIMELLIYLAKLSAYWIALYVLYALFLRRQTFLRWNRTYLLGSLVVAFVLPLVQYPEAAPPLPVVYQVSAASFTVVTAAASPSLLTWENLLWLVYGVGVVVMLVRLVGKFRHLFSFLQKGDRIPMEGYTLVLLDTNAAGSFSFMKWVFISPADYDRNFDTILTHELVHVRQRHSWDILLVEILHVLFWFNPVLLLYKNALQEVHEYLADQQIALAQAVTDHRDRYAEFLISYTLGTPTNVLTNQFFNAKLLKSRITMLYKNKNSNWSLGKYAAVALIIGCASLMVASCEREVMPSAASGEQMVKGNINVTGIINTPDHKPLMGATITDSQGKKGVITDEAGRFSLKVPAGADLKVSAPGLGAMDLKVNPKYKNADYDVTLSAKDGKPNNMVFSPSADGQSVKVTVQTGEVNGETIFTVVEKSPEFPGGMQELFKYLGENIKYPEAAAKANVSGKVFLNFVITSEGEIKEIKILKGLGFGADEESIRVVSKMPRWKPGSQDGKPVNVRYNLPIAFQLEKDKEIKANESDKKVGFVEQGTSNGPSTEGVTITYTGVGQARVVIDGVMQKEGYDIKKVGPENVEKVKVLKGESATKAYGEKGANGVIEVFMKKK